MTRAKRGFKARRRRKKILALASGFRGSRKNRFRTAIHVVRRALKFSYRDRRARKGDFRQLWIVRINAAARAAGMKYSEFMFGLKKRGITLDRSVLAELALHDETAFSKLVQEAKTALAK
ncbi:MAG: 50S ribosomal protein L20 [Deltaproteobacteria bacterium]|nr:50S ribosomal protein L20 [Deltaproteobacteria bacterium]